ncbi:hypothetical protein BU17DRAFT_86467 [Hysterangium stoloniferum]|nr:hypothetical protein BU17DRAFT_86467 [Hysterangium stoloniferum]
MSSHSTLVSPLPVELVDQIIDHLHSDIHALRSCSLVCRGWVPSARYHLFNEVKLSNTTSSAFVNLLRRSPHISPLVQILNITQDGMLAYSVPVYLNGVLPVLAKSLTHLRTLRLSNLDFSCLRSAAQDALLHQFSTIQSLSLKSVTFSRFHDFAVFIVAHPQLQHLHLHHVWWASKDVFENDHADLVLQPSYPSQLQSISLSETSYHIVEWLTLQYPSLPIRSITHSTVSKCDIPAMRNLLRYTGSSLHDLAISIHSIPNCVIEQSSEPALLLQNNHIRTLTLDNILLLSSDAQSCAWISTILAQLFSPYLEQIRLNIIWNAVEQLRAIDLEHIDELLSQPRFGQLKTVIIQSNGYTNVEEVAKIMEGRLKRLSKRGILRFY